MAEKRRKLLEDSLPVAQIDFSQPSTSTEDEGSRNDGNEETISSDLAAIAVSEGEEIEPETVKDAECQTTFDYMFQTSRYQAPNRDFFDAEDKVRFYTGLPSMEVLMVVFEFIYPHVTRQTQSLNRFQEFIIVLVKLRLNAPLQFPEYFPTGLLRWTPDCFALCTCLTGTNRGGQCPSASSMHSVRKQLL